MSHYRAIVSEHGVHQNRKNSTVAELGGVKQLERDMLVDVVALCGVPWCDSNSIIGKPQPRKLAACLAAPLVWNSPPYCLLSYFEDNADVEEAKRFCLLYHRNCGQMRVMPLANHAHRYPGKLTWKAPWRPSRVIMCGYQQRFSHMQPQKRPIVREQCRNPQL